MKEHNFLQASLLTLLCFFLFSTVIIPLAGHHLLLFDLCHFPPLSYGKPYS